MEIACGEEVGFIAQLASARAGRTSRIDDNLWGRTIGRRGDDGSRRRLTRRSSG